MKLLTTSADVDRESEERAADFRRAAYEQAAIVVVAGQFGVVAESVISPQQRHYRDERWWSGTTRACAPLDCIGVDVADLPQNIMRSICLAGVVAGGLLNKLEELNTDISGIDEEDLLCTIEVAVGILFKCGNLQKINVIVFWESEPERLDIKLAVCIVVERWSLIEMEARRLMAKASEEYPNETRSLFEGDTAANPSVMSA